MSERGILERVRSQPEPVRRKILAVLLGLCMVAVFFFWAGTYTAPSFNNTEDISSETSGIEKIRLFANDIVRGFLEVKNGAIDIFR